MAPLARVRGKVGRRAGRALLAAGASALMLSCGGPPAGVFGPPAYLAVTINPRPASMAAGASVTLTATVTNNLSVPQWSLLHAGAATTSAGTLTPVPDKPDSITYTAPGSPTLYDASQVPNCFTQGTVTVEATVAPPPKSTLPTAQDGVPIIITGGPVSVNLCPGVANLPLNAKVQFLANAVGSANLAFTWQVDGVTGGTASTGTIDAGGTYVAPATMPPMGDTVTITAIWSGDASKKATATVMLEP